MTSSARMMRNVKSWARMLSAGSVADLLLSPMRSPGRQLNGMKPACDPPAQTLRAWRSVWKRKLLGPRIGLPSARAMPAGDSRQNSSPCRGPNANSERSSSRRRTSRCSGRGRRRDIGVASRNLFGGVPAAERQGVGQSGSGCKGDGGGRFAGGSRSRLVGEPAAGTAGGNRAIL